MKVCKYGIYLFIYVFVDVLVQWIKWSVQDRTESASAAISLSRNYRGFIACAQPLFVGRVDSHDDIAYHYHIVDRIKI